MLTSGLASLWSQYCLTGLSALFQKHPIRHHVPPGHVAWHFCKMRPCFAAIRSNGIKLNDEKLKEQLLDAKSDRDEDRTDKLLRDAVEGMRMLLAGNAPQPVDVQVLPSNVDPEAAEHFSDAS